MPARHGSRLLALLAVAGAFQLARPPRLAAAERSALAASFEFSAHPLEAFRERRARGVRAVHPDFAPIASWISTVGAAVALNDFDGDGRANDACWVDTESDLVVLAPLPGTGARFEPLVLDPAPLDYDPRVMAPMGCVPCDVTEDGLLDVLVYYWGRPPIAFLRRTAGEPEAGAFAPQELADPAERWFTNAATWADVDGDGHLDLIVGNYFPDGAEVLDASATGRAHLHDSMSDAANGGRNRILLWDSSATGGEPEVHFVEAETGLPARALERWTLAVGAADLDGDQLPEIYFSNDFGPDLLVHNRSTPGRIELVPLAGQKHLTTPNSKALGRDSFKGMGVEFADLDGDGRLDIQVSNIAAEYALEEAHFVWMFEGDPDLMKRGRAPFRDRGEALGLSRDGWAWEVRCGDFDNDGTLEVLRATGFIAGRVNRWPELHETAMGNDQLLAAPEAWHFFRPGDELSGNQHNPFYVRASDGRWYDLAPDVGLGAPHVTRGIATADVDRDGDLDFVVANQWQAPVYYENRGAGGRAFLGLDLRLPLEGGAATRAAIGARVAVALPDGRRLVAEVDGGNGHSGVRSNELHFGLGELDPDTAVEVEIDWRAADGRPHRRQEQLAPGWHTLLLAAGEVE